MKKVSNRNTMNILLEAANPDLAEIKQAIAGLKVVIRKYAKADKAMTQEMIKSLGEMEKDLKALAKPAKK